MKKKSIIISIYAALVLVGGIMGYLMAHSIISLVVGTTVAFLLFVCSFLVWRKNLVAYDTTIAILFFLLVFFGYRFVMTHHFMPSGMMTLLTGLVFGYLVARKKFVRNLS